MRKGRSGFASGGRNGQAGLFIVLNLTIIFGTLGFAVDLGWAYYTRQSAQAAADAAAMAAAAWASASGSPLCGSGTVCNSTATGCSNPPTTPATTDLQAGCLYAQKNGFVNNGTSQIVTMAANTTAPPGVSNNSPSYWVQAKVSAKPYSFFGGFGGLTQFTINTSAIAAVSSYTAGACIYVLDPSASGAFSIAGSASVTTTCGIFVNSSSSDAYDQAGSSSVHATQILINGTSPGYEIHGSSSVSPTPLTNQGSVSDPLSGLSLPTFSNPCTAGPYSPYVVSGSGSATVPYGNYCGGITIEGSSTATFSAGNYIIYGGLTIEGSSTVTLGAGLYIVNGGGINIEGSSKVSGTGITFFNTGQYGQTISGVNTAGSATLNLESPRSGSYEGMLFLQDRNLSYAAGNSIAGSSSSVLTGTLYFPTTTLSYAGSSTTGTYTAVIAKRVSFVGSTSFKNDPTGTYTGLATTVRGLIQ